jgi:hypothetical protein
VRARCFAALVLALLLPVALRAQVHEADTDKAAPPVAPPLQKGSPLDHLTNDPKQDAPTVGYTEGHVSGPDFYVAHRSVDAQGGSGWGWVRKSSDGWDDAKWIALQEQPGLAVAPMRKLKTREGDNDWEFRFWGHFAKYQAYDPHLDELLPVFVLEGYQVLGQAAPLNIKQGPEDRVYHRPSGASSRPDRGILSDRGVD